MHNNADAFGSDSWYEVLTTYKIWHTCYKKPLFLATRRLY